MLKITFQRVTLKSWEWPGDEANESNHASMKAYVATDIVPLYDGLENTDTAYLSVSF